MSITELMPFTKIIATVGPASADKETLIRLVSKGVSIFRLNFSHGTHKQHEETIRIIRHIADTTETAISILQDLQGPKIRLGVFPGGPVRLQTGNSFTLTSREIPCNENEAHISYSPLPKEARPEDCILLNDGIVELKVNHIEGNNVVCKIIRGGLVSDHKGVNLPGMQLSTPALTEKDISDLQFGLDNGVNMVALSFVRHASDLDIALEIMKKQGRTIPIIAKLEKWEAIQELDQILEKADGVMVARGDLGVEVPFEELPLLQKKIIRKANTARKPVITATQMLISMVDHTRPTRAEITDVANAVLDGTDALMLSDETAVGQFPVETVETMAKIALEAEKGVCSYRQPPERYNNQSASEAVAEAACHAASSIGAKALVAFTRTGKTAELLSNYRVSVPIFAFTPVPETSSRLTLFRGVTPLPAPASDRFKTLLEFAETTLKQHNHIAPGDWVAAISSFPLDSQTTNLFKLHQVI